MPYHLLDEDLNDLGSGPSINGWRQVKLFVDSRTSDDLEALPMLIEHGVTHKTLKLAIECRALAKEATDPDVASTLNKLAISAGRAKGIVVLSH